MKLREIDFGYVMNASGARNFFGQGYPYHWWWRRWGLDYTDSTFVTKSTTLLPRIGNMPLDPVTLQPTELIPQCIKVNIRHKAVLNAVGLSGPGAKALFEWGIWQQQPRPFFLSYASMGATAAQRLNEWQELIKLTTAYLHTFAVSFGIEINPFCPNTGVGDKPVADEICSMLDIAGELKIPLVVKINVLMSHESAFQIERHGACDALCVSNTIPFGQMADLINWQKLWGKNESPLARFGGGGLSGPELFPLVMGWITHARMMGFRKRIIGCGGIFSVEHAIAMLEIADAIQIGSVSILRPWRVQSIIACTNAYARERYGA